MSKEMRVPFITMHPKGKTPVYSSAAAAGADLHACLDADIAIPPGKRILVPTGIAVALPEGSEGQVRPRSGLALKYGVTVLNAPGTIDSDYRGEIKVILINHGEEPFTVKDGDRIAQFVVCRVERAIFEAAGNLDETQRASGGFGSTGA